MKSNMTKVTEIKNYLKENLFNIDVATIEELYNYISNIEKRVNDRDKQFVACQQNIEQEVVENFYNSLQYANQNKFLKTLPNNNEDIESLIKKTCEEFEKRGIKNKLRIPFYIVFLNLYKRSENEIK